MRVLPILFNTEMVPAILDCRKTVTRRAVKPRSKKACGFYVTFRKSDNAFMGVYDYDDDERQFDNPQTPPCQPGDILYVREIWRVGYWDIRNQVIAFDYKDGTCGKPVYISDRDMFDRLVNQSREDARKAKCEYNGADFIWKKGKSPCRWHPSIHMPKEAARIWLKVTDVMVERLQEITEEQAKKEGCAGKFTGTGETMGCGWDVTPTEEFAKLWDTTVTPKDCALYGWNANPWVWVIEFERCGKPGE